MAGGKSDYLELKVLDHVYGKTTYTGPTNTEIALFTASPNDAGGGTEVTGGSYARVAVTNNTTNWPNAASGQKSNGTTITFPAPTANWGTCVAFGIFDAHTVGNLMHWGPLASPKTINNGDTAPSFSAGALVLSED